MEYVKIDLISTLLCCLAIVVPNILVLAIVQHNEQVHDSPKGN